MAQIGKFLEKNFKGKRVELYSGNDREWVEYADSTMINGTLIVGIYLDYDEECGIITMGTIDGTQQFYVAEDSIEMMWEPNFKLLENSITILNTGQRLFNRKNRDIM